MINLSIQDLEGVLTPLNLKTVGVISIDVTLGSQIWVQKDITEIPYIDLADIPKDHGLYKELTMSPGYYLAPREFIKAQVAEVLSVPDDWVAIFSLRSEIAQAGLEQSTSLIARPGWKGNLILELTNMANKPILISTGLLVGQFHFFRLQG